ISIDGKYAIYTNNNWSAIGASLLSDYGSTAEILHTGDRVNANMSYNGQVMMYLIDGKDFKISNDYGSTWNSKSNMVNIMPEAISNDGKIIAGRNWSNTSELYLSTNSGDSKTLITNSIFNKPWCNESGKYIIYYDDGSKEIMKSEDYGNTFSALTNLPVDLNNYTFRSIQRNLRTSI
ncbi:MAG: hypothetical protein ACOCP8_07035, partial [archaeon]